MFPHQSKMAAFYKNVCLWQNCGKKCGSLFDLIDHIEVIHIERDPQILEKQEASQPPAVALSYINGFFSESVVRRRKMAAQAVTGGSGLQSNLTPDKKASALKIRQNANSSDLGDSYFENESHMSDADSDDSCHSWSTTTSNSQDNDFSIFNRLAQTDERDGQKRFVCPVPGCGKRYKNINGIKYHTKRGHQKQDPSTGGDPSSSSDPPRKSYKCHCGKTYMSQSGLRHHQNTQHGDPNKPIKSKPKPTLPDSQLPMGASQSIPKTVPVATKLPHVDVYSSSPVTAPLGIGM